MSPELIAIIGTGVAFAGLNVTATIWFASRVSGVEQRIAKIGGCQEHAVCPVWQHSGPTSPVRRLVRTVVLALKQERHGGSTGRRAS